MLLSIVIPVYNSSKSLPELYWRIQKVMADELGSDYDFELIMVDDASWDESFQVMQELRQRDRRVKIIRLGTNAGQHNATLCGISASQGDYVVTMDDDLQHPPEEIPHLLAAIRPGYDAVFGVPRERQEAWYRSLGSTMVDTCLNIIYKSKHVRVSSFRIMTRETAARVVEGARYRGSIYLAALILEASTHLKAVPVKNDIRKYGRSNYTLQKAAGLTGDLLFNYSTIPLQLCIYLWTAAFLFIILTAAAGKACSGYLWAVLAVMAGLSLVTVLVFKGYINRFHTRMGRDVPYEISYQDL